MATSQAGWAMSANNTDSSGSLFHTVDGGKDWQQVTLPQGLAGQSYWVYVFDEDMAFLQPFQPAGAGTALLYFYRTSDAGVTWQRCNWPTTPETARLGMGTSDWWFLDHTHGWVVTPLPDPSMTRAGNDRTPFPARDETLFRTDDGGQHWQLVAHLPLKYASGNLIFHDSQTGWLTTAIHDPSHPDPSDPQAFPAVLYITHDGGRTWKQSSALPLPAQETSEPDQLFNWGDGYLLASFANDAKYLYMTQDSGNTWQVRGAALPADASYSLSVIDSTHIEVGGYLFTLINGLWVKTSSVPPEGNHVSVEFVSSLVGWALVRTNNDFDVYKTIDGGKTWQKIGSLPKGI